LHLALAHDLIAELSRLRWLLVTARASSFQFAGSDAAQAARRLGVRYLLTGQVEWHRQRIAVVVELTDTHAGQVVWGERFAGLVGDVHAIRSEISARVPAALDLQIPLREANRARLGEPAKLDAWLAFHLGLQHMYRFNAPDAQAAATHFRRALQLDPGLVRAHAGLSFVHFQAAFMNQTDDRPRESALARQHAERAVELDPLDPFANFTMGRSFWLDGDLEGSGEWLARATHISPSFAQGLYALGWKEVLCGQPLAARRNNDLAMRLSPFDPMYYAMLGVQAFSCLAQGDDEQAAVWSERAARAPGAHAYVAMIAAVMNHLAGNRESALRWRHAVAGSSQQLDASKFLEAFPMRHAGMRSRVTAALETLGF
jgi:tetratricopeptide (TPR) repeat protein